MFKKYKGDAFSNRELLNFLKKEGIQEVRLVGVDGGGCVALTAIGAIKNGFNTVLYTDAIGTTFQKNKEKYFKKLKVMGAKFI